MRLPTDAKAWKLFALQQTMNSTIPFLMITWAQLYVPASTTVVLASTTPIFAFLITGGSRGMNRRRCLNLPAQYWGSPEPP